MQSIELNMKQEIKQPTYHRQRFILAMITLLNEKLTVTNLQKLVFLAQEESNIHYFDFSPYRFGCYSFQLQADIEVLEKQQWLSVSNNKIELKNTPKNWLVETYGEKIRYFLFNDKSRLRGDKLIGHIYKNFPFYAINSEIVDRVLECNDRNKIQELKSSLSRGEQKILFTIGYEGISFETYINKLLQADVKLLCDVRKNPYSRKLGFSINSLTTILPKVGIQYIHLPTLGIISDKRRNLNTFNDYKALFDEYRTLLPGEDKQKALGCIMDLINKHKRIALTCFEHKHTECHRHCISDYLNSQFNIQQKHL